MGGSCALRRCVYVVTVVEIGQKGEKHCRVSHTEDSWYHWLQIDIALVHASNNMANFRCLRAYPRYVEDPTHTKLHVLRCNTPPELTNLHAARS